MFPPIPTQQSSHCSVDCMGVTTSSRMQQAAAASPAPAPLISALVVLQYGGAATVQVAALPHVVAAINDCLDYGLPQFWSLPRACEKNLLHLLPRLAARFLSSDVDPHYLKYQCRLGLVNAVKNDNLEMVEWLQGAFPVVLPYSAMIEASKTGNVRLFEWLADQHTNIVWLPHFMDAAASTGQLEMLQWLHAHPKNAGCSTKVASSAIRSDHLDAYIWLQAHYKESVKVMALDVRVACINRFTELTKYLLTNPEGFESELYSTMDWVAEGGDVELVQWFFAKSKQAEYIKVRTPMDNAAGYGHLHIVKWLHENIPRGCSQSAMEKAAKHGHLEIVQWLHANRTEGCTTRAMDMSDANGHLKVVKWLHENRTEGCTTGAMDLVPVGYFLTTVRWAHELRWQLRDPTDFLNPNGSLSVVKWLHENRSEGCTSDAMDRAAWRGQLTVLKWLHDNRTEGCSIYAMDYAAANGHLDVVRWLHENRTEGCTVDAMDSAAASGHLAVVQWLHENRAEGCSTEVVRLATIHGHFEVLFFLHANRSEGFGDMMNFDSETCIGNMEIMQWLYANYPDSFNDFTMILNGQPYYQRLLCEILQLGYSLY